MNVASRKRPSRFRRHRSPGQWSKIVHFFYLPSLFKTQKKQLIWDPFFYGCPRAVNLNNTSKMVSYDRQTRHQCIVLHRLLSNFFWWSHWTLTSNYIYTLFLAVFAIVILCKIWFFFLESFFKWKLKRCNDYITKILCIWSRTFFNTFFNLKFFSPLINFN